MSGGVAYEFALALARMIGGFCRGWVVTDTMACRAPTNPPRRVRGKLSSSDARFAFMEVMIVTETNHCWLNRHHPCSTGRWRPREVRGDGLSGRNLAMARSAPAKSEHRCRISIQFLSGLTMLSVPMKRQDQALRRAVHLTFPEGGAQTSIERVDDRCAHHGRRPGRCQE